MHILVFHNDLNEELIISKLQPFRIRNDENIFNRLIATYALDLDGTFINCSYPIERAALF